MVNYMNTLKEVNEKITDCKISTIQDLNVYIWNMKQPYALSSEGTIEFYTYFAMQNFCMFMKKCRDKYSKGLSFNKIEKDLKKYWNTTYNKFQLQN